MDDLQNALHRAAEGTLPLDELDVLIHEVLQGAAWQPFGSAVEALAKAWREEEVTDTDVDCPQVDYEATAAAVVVRFAGSAGAEGTPKGVDNWRQLRDGIAISQGREAAINGPRTFFDAPLDIQRDVLSLHPDLHGRLIASMRRLSEPIEAPGPPSDEVARENWRDAVSLIDHFVEKHRIECYHPKWEAKLYSYRRKE